MEKAVIYEVKDSVATITLNRPDRYNAVNQALVDGISDSLNKASNDENVRSVVLTGSGKGFCAGADMSVFGQKATPEQRRDYLIDQYQPLLGKFFDLKKPIIGAINGTAAGVGASFALACDFRVMSSESAILFAFINIGLGPDGGASWLLSRQVGYSKALEIATSGKKVLGDECLELAKKPTLAIGITKKDIFYSMNNDLKKTIAYEAERQVLAFGSHDLKEGVSAFIEKRKPNFLGK